MRWVKGKEVPPLLRVSSCPVAQDPEPRTSKCVPCGSSVACLLSELAHGRLFWSLAVLDVACDELQSLSFHRRTILLYEEDTIIGVDGEDADVV